MINFKYGVKNNYVDISDIVELQNNIYKIPASDEDRALQFGDHLFGIEKHILVNDSQIFPSGTPVNIPNIKVIVLIIDADSIEYNKMRKIWRKYMNSFDTIKAFFIRAEENPVSSIVNDTIYYNGKETYENIIYKTIFAFELISKLYPFVNFIYRTNLSAFADYHSLISYTDQCAIEKLYAGWKLYNTWDPVEWRHIFVQGSGILISRDVLLYIITTFNSKDFVIDHPIDDVIIGKILEGKVNITPSHTIADFNNFINIYHFFKHQNIYHYRCKGENCIEIQELLCKMIYNLNNI